MGKIRDFFAKLKSNRNKKIEERSIIAGYYGNNNFQYYVWNYAQQIYKIPEVRTAINKIAEIFSTMPVYHKVGEGAKVTKITKISDPSNYVLGLRANPLQNKIQFFQNCINKLLLDNNLFVEPIFDINGNLQQVYPLMYKEFEIVLEKQDAYVKFFEQKGGSVIEKHNLNNLIYLSRFCSLSGGQENDLGLYDQVIDALQQQILKVCSPNQVKAIMSGKYSSGQLKKDDKKGATEELEINFAHNVRGVAYMDEKWQITPINWQENEVNKDLMQTVINTVYNYFGINENIIKNTANEFEMELFIATTIKPLADQFELEFTSKLFTKREIEIGHKIEFDVFALSIATLGAKTSFFATASRNGVANIDEMRSMVGLPPLPNGLGQTYRVSADCVDIKIADKYQLGKFGLDKDQTNEVVSTTSENVSRETISKVDDINKSEKEESNGRDSEKE